MKPVIGILLLAIELLTPVNSSSDIDLHWLWDDRCAACHGHSSEFSHEFLTISDGMLQGRHHINDLKLFLGNHYLSGQSVNEIYAMLLGQVSRQVRFKIECSSCHQNAASFVREKLQFEGVDLRIQESGKNVRDFLENHRRLSDDDIEFYSALLSRIAKEVNLP